MLLMIYFGNLIHFYFQYELRYDIVRFFKSKENRIYIRGEFRESLGMNFFSPFQPELKESLGMNFFQSLSALKGVQSVQIM